MHAAFENAGRVKGLELWRIEVSFFFSYVISRVLWVAKHKYCMTNGFEEKINRKKIIFELLN